MSPFLQQANGKPIIALVDTFCQACGALASGSIRRETIHVPCGECFNHEASIDIPLRDAIPIPFADDDGSNERIGVVSRRDFGERFPDASPPRRDKVLRHWRRVQRDIEADAKPEDR